jgi:hypothetical protein
MISSKRLRPLLCAVLLASLPAPLLAVVTLDADFDHGSLDVANSSVVANTILLSGRDNYNTGDWKWLYFEASGVNGLTPTFDIDDDFASGSSRLDNHSMVYSYDQQNWFFFDNNQRSAGLGRFTFSNNAPFTQDSVYVAYGLPYSYQRVVDLVAGVKTSPYVSPTLSSNANLVVAQSPGGIDDLGRNIAPKDLYGFKVTDASAVGPKEKVVLISGVHANETLGNHTLEGLIDFLVSADPRAAELRKKAEFYIYPMVNPDGRFAGYNRSTVQHEDRDPNRYWTELKYDDMTDVKAIGEAMKADTGSDIDYFIDFHSTVDTEEHFGYTDFQQGMHLTDFWTNFLALEPAFRTYDAGLSDDTSIKFANNQLNSDFVVTFETEFIPGENIDRFQTLGMNVGIAFQMALAPLPPSGIAEDFMFDDVNGTLFQAAANSANPGNQWTADANLSNSSVQAGSFLIEKNNNNTASSYLQIDDITSGEAWLVMEIDGWNLTTYDPAEPEELRLGFLDNDTLGGSIITAQVEIERNGLGGIEINGQALGAGSNLAAQPLDTVQSEPFTIVLHLDKDNNTYEIMYKDGNGAWASLGTGNVDPARDGNVLRFVANNHFGGPGEFFDIGRIYLSYDNPLAVALIGDLNGDGFVGIADLNIVLGAWNQNVTPGDPLAGDPTGDGFVGIADLNLILGNWNTGTPPISGANIPEPTSAAALGLSSLIVLWRNVCGGR